MANSHSDLARLMYHKTLTEEGGKKKKTKTDTSGSSQCVLHQGWYFRLVCLSQWRKSGFFHMGWVGRECWGTHRHIWPFYRVLEKGSSSQLILLPVVKQLIALKQLGQTIASSVSLSVVMTEIIIFFNLPFPAFLEINFLMTAVGFHFCSCF